MDAQAPVDYRFFAGPEALASGLGAALSADFLAPEERVVRRLCDLARLPEGARAAVQERALQLVRGVRAAHSRGSGLDALLREYHLASPEGVVLMCLAEALLRIPDARTADRLIADKLAEGDWERHLGDSESLLVNASTWGLMLTGRLVELDRGEIGSLPGWFGRLATRLGEPVARGALRQAMRVLGHQFVMGRSIGEALQRTTGASERRYAYSFDMLGEAAITASDAQRYFEKYRDAISEIARHARREPGGARPGISVKLSALHPRYEFLQGERVRRELAPRLLDLVGQARAGGIGLTVDAEEADRLELSLWLIEAVLASDLTAGYDGFGIAVQAYQKRAYGLLQWLIQRSQQLQRRIAVRLVKGAYWDSEIKRAQERGLAGFPVFTRKINTDVSYLACARLLADHTDVTYPQFATHNAHTVAYVSQLMAGTSPERFEFQRLHGMGEELYEQLVGDGSRADHPRVACRVYAPVGPHEELLPYLVRRLLENGANTSFVNRLVDERLPPEQIISDPVAEADQTHPAAEPRIALPAQLFAPQRRNSRGVNFADGAEIAALLGECRAAQSAIAPIAQASAHDIEQALSLASAAQPAWNVRANEQRAALLEQAADLFEAHRAQLIGRCVQEAGRTVPDSAAEVREAIDFLRYYASQARILGAPALLAGPTGESNTLRVRGRGVFACISPWNFPVSIFTGQVSAALVTGNAVIAKPAEQTPSTAALAVELLHRAGIPTEVLQLLPGGPEVGEALTRDARICGVVFTGSTATARRIERTLAGRPGAIATLIAETGGINVMIVDSSALPEQVVLDTVTSAFNSAGQRCSALRVLLLQEEIAPRVLELLAGQMDELRIGPPAQLDTDVGPVIDDEALAALEDYAARVTAGARWHYRARIPAAVGPGRYFAPLAVEVASLAAVEREVFGPVLHIVRYAARDLDAMVDAINRMGYGLTLGIHTRIDSSAQAIADRVLVGNVYVNRNMIGAVVGVQPFGGSGLSGTGPKAGGPHYLQRFVTEQTLTVNTAALGGNASLLSL